MFYSTYQHATNKTTAQPSRLKLTGRNARRKARRAAQVATRLCLATIFPDGNASFLSYSGGTIRTYKPGKLDPRIADHPLLPQVVFDSLVEAIRPLVGKPVLMTVAQARQLFRVRLADFDRGH